jgi:hypothetical protein
LHAALTIFARNGVANLELAWERGVLEARWRVARSGRRDAAAVLVALANDRTHAFTVGTALRW